MSASNFPGYHSSSYSSRTLSCPAKTTLVQESLSHGIHWEAPELHCSHLHDQSTEMMLEEKYFLRKSWFVKPNSNGIFAWYAFSQLESGDFPKKSAFLWKQTAAESSQYHLWLHDSRSYPPVIKPSPSVHTNNHLLNLVGKTKQNKPQHIDLICLGLGMQGKTQGTRLALMGARCFMWWLQQADNLTWLSDADS